VIDDTICQEIQTRFGPLSPEYLRNLLRESKATLAPEVEGVRQNSLEALERTLLALALGYSTTQGPEAKRCRDLVIEAKDHARWALKRTEDPARIAMKEEMILWMLTWLENPVLFAEWLELRKRALQQPRC
jgi:hypothetical protein